MSDTAATEEAPRRRPGGRAARVAARAAGPAGDKRPVRPGMSGGRYAPLSESECRQVYEAALSLLEEIGMGSPIQEFIDVVTAAGGHVIEDRLHFPRALVEEAISTAASSFTWYGFDDNRSIDVGGDRVHFGTAGAAVSVWDHETRRHRPSTLLDVYDVARLVDTLEHIHFHVRTLVPRDMVEARDLDLNTAYAVAMGTTMPIGTSFFQPEHVVETVEMFDQMLGGRTGSFAERPFCVANNTFVVPPLRYAEDAAEAMVAQVRAGMPINLLSAGQAGATSPAALAGSLAQALAECLSALTFVNLMKPGHPCVMGLWPFVSDLRTGAMTGGSGAEAVLNAAAAQMANWLNLPSGVPAGMADSKMPDNQAGHEKGMTVALAGNAGANLVYESAGMLASLLACSFEGLVIDNDMLGAVNRTVRGIEVNPETLSTEVIREVVHGAGHFLDQDQTLSIMQTEYVYPEIGDRLSPEDWFDAGATSADERAREHVRKVLSTHFPSHIPPDVDAAVRDRFDIHLPVGELTGTSRW
ncbi:MAG: trimethylamine methyltransferase family protein [Acidimicrobiales bacterium]|nr:trimethylamine methyltransferase family protein [Acidimicrobiales bacterium]MDP7208820.1 trimethylamine methyltransferase family protein [Acidimicrobiales bacterium]HJO99850.1 trimethylamine methyltransferase family protein [Acidimicrobiales bacterium]